jgi:hypothetical protein
MWSLSGFEVATAAAVSPLSLHVRDHPAGLVQDLLQPQLEEDAVAVSDDVDERLEFVAFEAEPTSLRPDHWQGDRIWLFDRRTHAARQDRRGPIAAQSLKGREVLFDFFGDDRPGRQVIDEALVTSQGELTVAREVSAVLDVPAD